MTDIQNFKTKMAGASEVWCGDRQIGFIPRDLARTWAEWMEKGAALEARIHEFVTPRGSKRHIGVVRDVEVTPA